jgi:hypothetical protein
MVNATPMYPLFLVFRYMKGGSLRFMLLSLCQISNMKRSSSPYHASDEKVHKRRLNNKGFDKHRQNHELGHSKRKKKKKQKPMVHGRLPVPEYIKKNMPDGFVPELAELETEGQRRGHRKYEVIDPRIFQSEEVQAELIQIIRLRIPEIGFGRPSSAVLMRTRMDLQGWLVQNLQAR